jgi:radical SAM superfamily enzyme YgiQ (UPF0313 family)
MNILLVYPETPKTFWSFDSALKFIAKKSSEPPLGLITVAAMLPKDWQMKLIDTNVSPLTENHIRWADYVFLTGMNVHKQSFKNIIRRCNILETPVVAGGPMVTAEYEEFLGVDHFILNEAEVTLPPFLNDLKAGCPKPIYRSGDFPEITTSPAPLWHLLEINQYASMSIQYSRGCPYHCEFCSITMLNGHRPRCKNAAQFTAELDALYACGWRGNVFIVDDNFIGNRKKVKSDLLPALAEWNARHQHPFSFSTEASINIADDDELIRLMVRAGFDHAFIGIETPSDASLDECGKSQNRGRDMVQAVDKLHQHGIRVSAGFILGFDSDPADIFDQLIRFIRNSGIVTAMVGLLNAPTGTRLFNRLREENRLLKGYTGDNMDGSLNFVPKMPYQKLVAGYRHVLETVYSPREYYERVKTFLEKYQVPAGHPLRLSGSEIYALLRSLWVLGIREPGRRYYWKLFFLGLFRYPRKFGVAITMAVYGFHFRRVIRTV